MKNHIIAFRESKAATILWLIGINFILVSVLYCEIYGEGLRGTVHFKFMGYGIYPIFFLSCFVANAFFLGRLRRNKFGPRDNERAE